MEWTAVGKEGGATNSVVNEAGFSSVPLSVLPSAPQGVPGAVLSEKSQGADLSQGSLGWGRDFPPGLACLCFSCLFQVMLESTNR